MESSRSGSFIQEQGQGLIRIQTQSPYECLDPASSKWLNQLKQMWSLWRKSDAVTAMLYEFFSNSQNPYVSVLQIMITCGDFYVGKPSSLSYNIMENFAHWTETQSCNIQHCLTKELKLDAFNLVTKQKNSALVKLVANVYQMASDKETFLGSIRYLIESNMYKEACQCAAMLELHDHFGIEEFVVPLVFQDKFAVAEEFLIGSPVHQVQIASFMDVLLGKKNIKSESESIIKKLGIHDPKLDKLYYKPLSKLVARIVKTFNLPQSTCPNLTKKRGEGALQFLLNKRYIGRTIGDESWAEMALEAVGDDKNLQLELVTSVACYGEISEALQWAERFSLPFEQWPQNLQEYSGRIEGGATSAAPNAEENWDDWHTVPSLKFHELPLPESQIYLVDTPAAFSNFLDALANGVYIVGIDSEWKPSIGIKKCDLALIQVATFDTVYILDVLALGPTSPDGLWEQFANELFANPDILKLGFGLGGDLSIMKDTLPCFNSVKLTGLGFMDLVRLWKVLTKDHQFAFPFPSHPESSSSTSESLNRLVELCLGETLDKSDQFSNWERRPLRKSQILYAALDAYCLLEVYNVLRSQAEAQNIPFIEILNEIMANQTTPKKLRRKKGEKVGEKPASEANHLERFNKNKISVMDIHILCDTMLAGLGKQLRKCGIDTIILEPCEEPSSQVIGRKRFLNVVTKSTRINHLVKFGQVYRVRSEHLKEQLEEVLDYFNVDVSAADIFSRCMGCNCNEFAQITQEDMKKLAWISSRQPLHPSCQTKFGASIAVYAVPAEVFDEVPLFFVCEQCGKCYWEGSHRDRAMRGFIGKMVRR